MPSKATVQPDSGTDESSVTASESEQFTTLRISVQAREDIRKLGAEQNASGADVVSGLLHFYQSRTKHQYLNQSNDIMVELRALESAIFALNDLTAQIIELCMLRNHQNETRLLEAIDNLIAQPPAHLGGD